MSPTACLGALALSLTVACTSGPSEPATPEMSYRALCAGCHGLNGAGAPPQYPPLTGHIPQLLAAEGGRAYLGKVAVFGVEGPIVVNGAGWDGLMTGVRAAPHEDVARALAYATTAWGHDAQLPAGFAPYTAQEIEAWRAEGLAPHDVRKLRPPPTQPAP